jgi:hypothetical protein
MRSPISAQPTWLLSAVLVDNEDRPRHRRLQGVTSRRRVAQMAWNNIDKEGS